MAHIRLTEHIEAPIEDVFELFIDAKRWPEWMAGSTEVKEITGPPDLVGTRIRDVSTFMGRQMESWTEVVEVERPHLYRFTSESGAMKGTGTFRLTPAGQGTDVHVENEYDLPAGFLGEIADRLFIEKAMERQMRHSAENFKALAEAKVAVPA
jgi:coenzyme Q-binding protein COQ10